MIVLVYEPDALSQAFSKHHAASKLGLQTIEQHLKLCFREGLLVLLVQDFSGLFAKLEEWKRDLKKNG
jgi:DNA-binding transcriptional ArsR family regulator